MEALRKLERVQGMLLFMQAEGISAGESNSDRFIAEFIIFLMQPHSINSEKACQLINRHLPKISSVLLTKEAVHPANEVCEQNCDEFHSEIAAKKKEDPSSPNTDEGFPLILHAMEKANSTLEDFCRSYFMFHGMEVKDPHQLFKFLPVLFFTESYIYQLDIMNEKRLCLTANEVNRTGKSYMPQHCSSNLTGNQTNSLSDINLTSFDPLISVLRKLGLLNDRIEAQFQLGIEYWYLERKLCQSLTSKMKISMEDVMKALHLKSFDYRVLNLLLYQLRNEQVNELHMEFLSVSEFLVEISDDLYDYEDDVIENSFNILRMFVRLYGPQMAPSRLAECISEFEKKYERLLGALGSDLASRYQRRCEEAAFEGGRTSGNTLGTWNIPSVITDEDSYRSQFMNSNSPAY